MEELETTGNESPEENPPDETVPPEAAGPEAEPEPEPEHSPHPVVIMETVLAEDLLAAGEDDAENAEDDGRLRAVIEALVYVAEDPVTVAQMAASLEQAPERIQSLLDQLIAEYDRPEHGFAIREVAGGYRMATKPEHHDAVRAFAKSLKPPLKLSLPALETLAVIAYKQPVTAPEIKEIRGVQGTGVLNTLLDRKLIAEAGRKNVIGKPILYKTTKEFLIQFGLKDLSELPTLKEFEEIRRMAFADIEPAEAGAAEPAPEAATDGETPAPATAADAETAKPEVPPAGQPPDDPPQDAPSVADPAPDEQPPSPNPDQAGSEPSEA